jgi:leucyl aminopeptidase
VGVKFAGEHDGAEAEILDEHQMEALGMGSLLAVARGSANRPRLVVLKWTGGGDAKPMCWSARASPSIPVAST